jgi:23S rRNA pseudouridine955/2504/2580 synthase
MSVALTKSKVTRGEVNHLRIDSDQAGRRIDNLLVSLLGDVPKSHIYKLLRRGEVRLNGKRAKPETRVETDDILRLPPIHPAEGTPAGDRTPKAAGHRGDFLLSQVLFEDDTLMVINKPAGMTVHAGTGQQYGLIETLRNAHGEGATLELVHRLDRDTSGCLVIAKSMRGLRRLHDQFREGSIAKRYLLLAQGHWKGPPRSIDVPLHKDRREGGEAVVRVDAHGKHAVTHFALERQFEGCCLLSADLETGRTHQIRVHAHHGGFPLAGDEKYGDAGFNKAMREYGLRRLFLHAEQITIPMDEAPPLTVRAPLPADLSGVLEALAQRGQGKRTSRPNRKQGARR